MLMISQILPLDFHIIKYGIIFADDTNMSLSSSCLNELEFVVNNTSVKVLRSNKLLSVNSKKTNYGI